ncbi:unnamed protein product [Spirodela intermedia]|uniref:Uncharacterized protein n=1 Tax=Spirodela intermedia TaxID=51605 RepID=A0A7I8IRA4_SPIIN|nr:unnamed protein product [Spirodela intermedia]CAA6660077.1 unnamed protein product [Spirodela intermedia]
MGLRAEPWPVLLRQRRLGRQPSVTKVRSPQMPPSPSMSSSRRELMTGNSSTSTRSLVKAKEDDLALFKDMQLRERDEFLLCSSDDFEDSLSKLKYFPDFKLNNPDQGESNDLLNAECEKNDYEWLLTPPETPLFPSLDDDEPKVAGLVPVSSSQTQPISITKSSTTESRGRKSRSSVSPRGRSPSARSAIGLPVSGRHSSPPSKLVVPTPRFSTPTVKRMSSISSGSGSISSSTRKGASPVKASRGSSASPKLRGWQPNAPGFARNPPPAFGLLSLIGRHHVREVCRQHKKQSGPTFEKCEAFHVANSFYKFNGGATDSLMLRKNGRFSNGGSMVQSNKLSRAVSASYAPKSSFDTALRQMDHHKTSEGILKTVLSSVPARSFSVGKASYMDHPMFSMNASTNTSSDGGSVLDASAAPEAEGGEHGQNDMAGRAEKMLDIHGQEGIFTFDKMDGVAARTIGAEELEQLMSGVPVLSDVCSIPLEPILSVCKEKSQKLETADEDVDVCQLSEEKIYPRHKTPSGSDIQPIHLNIAVVVDESCEKSHPEINIPEATEDINGQISICKSPSSLEKDRDSSPEISSTALTANEREQIFSFAEFECGPEIFSAYSRAGGRLQRFHSFSSYQNIRIGGPEGAGTPVHFSCSEDETKGADVDLSAGPQSTLMSPSAAQDGPLIADSTLCGEPSSSAFHLSSPRQEDGFLKSHFSCSEDETKGADVDLSAGPQSTLMSASAAQDGPLVADSTLKSQVLDPVHMNSSEAEVGGSVELSTLNPHGTVPDESHRILISCPLELMNETENTIGDHMPASDALNDEHLPSSVNAEGASQDQAPTALDSCPKEVDETVNGSPHNVGAPSEPPLQSSSGALPGRVDADENFMYLPIGRDVSQSLSCTNESSRTYSLLEETDGIVHSFLKTNNCETGVMVEAPVGNKTRCLTLEEATDTILFCSSIVQDLAFQSAAIGMEKEHSSPQEDYRPTVASPEKPASDERSPRRSTTKSTKARRKISEMDAKIMAAEPGSNGKIHKFSPSKAEPPDKVGHAKPLKQDSSKMCSCTVM